MDEAAIYCSNCKKEIKNTNDMLDAPIGFYCNKCIQATKPINMDELIEEHQINNINNKYRKRIRISTTKLIYLLIITNVIVFIIQQRFTLQTNNLALYDKYTILHELSNNKFWVFIRWITDAFLHANVMHIFFNMISLWYLSRMLQFSFNLSNKIFLGIYFTGSILGSTISFIFLSHNTTAMGASNAIISLFGFYSAVAIYKRVNLLMITMNIALIFIIYPNLSGGHLDTAGHAGGIINGLLCGTGYILSIKYNNTKYLYVSFIIAILLSILLTIIKLTTSLLDSTY